VYYLRSNKTNVPDFINVKKNIYIYTSPRHFGPTIIVHGITSCVGYVFNESGSEIGAGFGWEEGVSVNRLVTRV